MVKFFDYIFYITFIRKYRRGQKLALYVAHNSVFAMLSFTLLIIFIIFVKYLPIDSKNSVPLVSICFGGMFILFFCFTHYRYRLSNVQKIANSLDKKLIGNSAFHWILFSAPFLILTLELLILNLTR